MAVAARVDSMREGWRGMTGLNLERLSWIPSGGKGALLSWQIVPSSGTTRVTQPIAHVGEQSGGERGGENNKVFTMIRHET